MSHSDDFPWPTRISAAEFARLLYEKEIELKNQEDSRSPETQPPRFSGACTYLSRKEAAGYLRMSPECVLYHVDGGDERRSSAIVTVTNDDIPKTSNGSLQVNAVQWAGEKQTYMMRMAMRGALGISPNDDTDCHHGVERTGYAATNFK
jgi:hypothetical protein